MGRRIFAGWLVFAAATCSVAGIVLLFVPLGSFFDFGWPARERLMWDAALSFAFFLQHSGMVRRPVRRFLHVPEPYWMAVYATASGAVLVAVCLLWQSTGTLLVVFSPPLRVASYACAAVGLLIFAFGIRALRGFDPIGAHAVAAHLRGKAPAVSPFVVRGPYRWVRHPLYSAILLLFWTAPDPTLDRLLFTVLWTAWIFVATRLEDRDLIADFGETYARYRRSVPALIPWHLPKSV